MHGDVFRPPQHPVLLTMLVGSGMHLFSMTLVVLGKKRFICTVVGDSSCWMFGVTFGWLWF